MHYKSMTKHKKLYIASCISLDDQIIIVPSHPGNTISVKFCIYDSDFFLPKNLFKQNNVEDDFFELIRKEYLRLKNIEALNACRLKIKSLYTDIEMAPWKDSSAKSFCCGLWMQLSKRCADVFSPEPAGGPFTARPIEEMVYSKFGRDMPVCHEWVFRKEYLRLENILNACRLKIKSLYTDIEMALWKDSSAKSFCCGLWMQALSKRCADVFSPEPAGGPFTARPMEEMVYSKFGRDMPVCHERVFRKEYLRLENILNACRLKIKSLYTDIEMTPRKDSSAKSFCCGLWMQALSKRCADVLSPEPAGGPFTARPMEEMVYSKFGRDMPVCHERVFRKEYLRLENILDACRLKIRSLCTDMEMTQRKDSFAKSFCCGSWMRALSKRCADVLPPEPAGWPFMARPIKKMVFNKKGDWQVKNKTGCMQSPDCITFYAVA